MSIQAMRAVLVADSAVTALVPATRIEPTRRTQGAALPAIVLEVSSRSPVNHLTGYAGLDELRVTLTIHAETYHQAMTLAAACRSALQNAGYVMESGPDGYEPAVDPEEYTVQQAWVDWD